MLSGGSPLGVWLVLLLGYITDVHGQASLASSVMRRVDGKLGFLLSTKEQGHAEAGSSLLERSAEQGEADRRSRQERIAKLEQEVYLSLTAAITPDMGDFLEQVLNYTAGMLSTVFAAHATDQDLLNKEIGKINSCVNHSNFTRAYKRYTDASVTHKECRREEESMHRHLMNCSENWSIRRSVIHIICENRTVPYDNETCVPTENQTYKAYLQTWSAYYTAQLKAWKNSTEICNPLVKNVTCNETAGSIMNQTGKCNMKQRDMDRKACTQAEINIDMCHDASGCYNRSVSDYRDVESLVRDREEDRKLEWELLLKIRCLADNVPNKVETGMVNKTRMKRCMNATYNVSQVTIVHPPIPSQLSCENPTHYPCTTEYLRDEYDTSEYPRVKLLPCNASMCSANAAR